MIEVVHIGSHMSLGMNVMHGRKRLGESFKDFQSFPDMKSKETLVSNNPFRGCECKKIVPKLKERFFEITNARTGRPHEVIIFGISRFCR